MDDCFGRVAGLMAQITGAAHEQCHQLYGQNSICPSLRATRRASRLKTPPMNGLLHGFSSRNRACFAVTRQPDLIHRQTAILQCYGKIAHRVVKGLLGQFEGTPVHTHGLLRL